MPSMLDRDIASEVSTDSNATGPDRDHAYHDRDHARESATDRVKASIERFLHGCASARSATP